MRQVGHLPEETACLVNFYNQFCFRTRHGGRLPILTFPSRGWFGACHLASRLRSLQNVKISHFVAVSNVRQYTAYAMLLHSWQFHAQYGCLWNSSRVRIPLKTQSASYGLPDQHRNIALKYATSIVLWHRMAVRVLSFIREREEAGHLDITIPMSACVYFPISNFEYTDHFYEIWGERYATEGQHKAVTSSSLSQY